jgi:hypothetical protein
VFSLSESFDDEREAKEGEKVAVQVFESGEDAAVAVESAKEPLDFVPFSVECPVIALGIDAIAFRRNHRNHAQFEHQLRSLIAFIGAIHEQEQPFGHRPLDP